MVAARTILVVEDNTEVAALLRAALERDGYECRIFADGAAALADLRQASPDLILLDRILPGLSGDDVLRRLKADPRWQSIPVIMLTGKADETDQLVGLALGADDYVGKPFSPRLLLARIAAQLRRQDALCPSGESEVARSLALDPAHARVLVDHVPVRLSEVEYRLLATLIAARGHVLARAQLATLLYGKSPPPDAAPIDAQIRELRRKIGPAGTFIQSVPIDGYAFCGPVC